MSAMEIEIAIDGLFMQLQRLDHEPRHRYDTSAANRIIMQMRQLQRLDGREPTPLFQLV